MGISLSFTRTRPGRCAAILLLALAALSACDWEPAGPEPPVPPEPPFIPPPPPPAANIDQQLRSALTAIGIQPLPPVQPQPAALVSLGQALFFDKVLSGNRDISCATCHHPVNASGDAITLSIGTGGSGIGAARTLGPRGAFLARNAPALFNLGGLQTPTLFWDGRVARGGPQGFTTPAGAALPSGLGSLLAAQAMFPVLARDEMRGQRGDVDVLGAPNELAGPEDSDVAGIWRAVMARLLAIPEYVDRFRGAFPGVPVDQLGFQHAANAIAAFETDAFAKGTAAVDRYLQGNDAALSLEAKRGGLLFAGQARCSSCHSGSTLSTQSFVNIGVPQLGPGRAPAAPLDWGMGGHTGRVEQRFLFRTASLRNVELTAPYMHNGAYASLDAVVRHYNDVARANRTYDVSQIHPQLRSTHRGDEATITTVLATLDGRLRQPMGLSDGDISDIVAFLRSLTDPAARDMRGAVPPRVPSGLPLID